ncbi:phospholipase A-2-activating protein, putative [Phytophthora infestans T30-4]|uniref:Phospholipase A-2-activating protein, putative n=2 Tax=Phytophthora infestans TaxID=4787 RepID=D0NSL9_PHYIT|nr:phospholipase A-2-activating protein, putative [Phytophthora infestans T30-4]EEY64581.1 phospholipase A-2-activating protein, putative [Phytophthora infestans T30-4]KAF4039176.1 PUL domain-containing protein [Phytophthora infestans]KAF4135094.1 PUL domain-containing protein [Phytophthora infestans]|eukprot:XP_002897781.1 phospholipase A-2-activating protein, putative [Phytophthora infestans T30-4]
MMATYDVNCELRGHEGAIRSISSLSTGLLLTGAMDSVARLWLRDSSSTIDSFIAMENAVIFDHEHWVTASVALEGGGFATGSMDKNIRLFDAQGQRYGLLQGHEGGVISLAISTDRKLLLSGSWDGTARVWSLETLQCLQILPGHENGVCVLGLPDGSLVTGSTGQQVGNSVANFKLRFWAKDTYALTKTLTDHQGPIRQLALVPDIGFVSCSNDGSIKLRALDGTVLASMEHPLNTEGKPGFVLGVCVLSNGFLVSASEDCTARVWSQEGALVQTVEHPGGLWCVTALGNGDFATGCDDKVVRVFTHDAARMDPSAVASFQAAVDDARIAKTRGPSGVEIDALPDYDHRASVNGSSDGQIQMFRRGAKAWACQWSEPSRTWIDIGEVTGTGGGGVVDGEAFDMVIPVEIELPGGLKKLEIGYNQGQNPFTVAQAFIDKHMLDQGYLREIADYITQRAAEYRPPVLGNDDSAISTPSGAAPTCSGSAVTSSRYKYFPVPGYNTFETTKITKLMATLRQFNDKMKESQAPEALIDSQLIALDQIAHTVQDTAFFHSSTFAAAEITTLRSVLDKWPAKYAFPTLDLLRLVLVHPQGPAALGEAGLATLVTQVLTLGLQPGPTDGDDAIPMSSRMLSLRVLANMFLHDAARKAILAHKTVVLSKLPSFQAFHHKLVALSLSTVLLNFARAQVANPGALTPDDQIVVVSLSADLLNGSYTVQELGDDTILRSLVTIGTLALTGDAKAKEAAGVHIAIFSAAKASEATSQVVQDCLAELQQVLC